MEIRRGCPKTQLEVSGHMSVERNVFPRNFCLAVSDMRLIHDFDLTRQITFARAQTRRPDDYLLCADYSCRMSMCGIS
jgi:hypothetical protein